MKFPAHLHSDTLLISMDKVEFLFKCIQDGKISGGQACAMLGNSKSNTVDGKSWSVPATNAPGPAIVTTGALKQPIESIVYKNNNVNWTL